MKQHKHLEQFEQQTQQAEQSACFSRFGTIVDFNEAQDSVRVDFEGNPFGQPLSARLGRGFRKSELQLAIDNKLNCRIEFINQDISLPVVTDVFFSMLDDGNELVIRAEKMTIETSQELIVKSGETQTRYSGRDGRITTQAKYVTSQAEKAQKIQGGTIAIN
ncbi:hypothetical protein F0267_27770 [Vibrio coralliilyticus]|uniref:Uncharacterized protein n=1 Tax=Vibrio coralliilyticus TaxID=190893 RepID=A0AAN0SEP4_9VIBR|nr:hypothetical protein [Vibrio coralliilyticus]AIW21224.1 hypothetical protein IX92_19560 [Vibrio coralliilyticus]NOH42033.1 hypothetical protein [Vibrio coralliilyticus]